jgi:hypothetical protein
MGARRKRWQRGDSFWVFLAVAYGGGGVLAVLAFVVPEGRVSAVFAILALTAIVTGSFGVAVHEAVRVRREGRSLPSAIVRGLGNGLRTLWQSLMS